MSNPHKLNTTKRSSFKARLGSVLRKSARAAGHVITAIGGVLIVVFAVIGIFATASTVASDQSDNSQDSPLPNYPMMIEACPDGQRHVDVYNDTNATNEQAQLTQEIIDAYIARQGDGTEVSNNTCVTNDEFDELFKAAQASAQAEQSIRDAERAKQVTVENEASDELQRQIDALAGNDKKVIDLIVNTYLDFDFTSSRGIFASRASEMYADHWSYDALATSRSTLMATIEMLDGPMAGFNGGLTPKNPGDDPYYSGGYDYPTNPGPPPMEQNVFVN